MVVKEIELGDEEVVVEWLEERSFGGSFMVELCEEDEDGRRNEKDVLFNMKPNDQSRKAWELRKQILKLV
ncbi:hypothetical protein Tco_1076929 [Tanacetum coccineum]